MSCIDASIGGVFTSEKTVTQDLLEHTYTTKIDRARLSFAFDNVTAGYINLGGGEVPAVGGYQYMDGLEINAEGTWGCLFLDASTLAIKNESGSRYSVGFTGTIGNAKFVKGICVDYVV